MVLLRDVLGAGEVTPGAEQATRFIEKWHGTVHCTGDPGLVLLVSLQQGHTNHVVAVARSVTEMTRTIESLGLDGMVARDGFEWNLYVNVLLVNQQPVRGRRGGKGITLWSPGLCADLDVKPGAFSSKEEILAFLRSLWPLWPTLIVSSGSGGLQPYWVIEGGLSPQDYEHLMLMLWTMLKDRADGRLVDKVTSSDRIMRLPGSIRWGKDAVQEPRPVELMFDSGPVHTVGDVARQCEKPWDAWRAVQSETQWQANLSKADAERVLISAATHEGWPGLVSLAQFEDAYNSKTTWDWLLVPAGWTLQREDSEGRRYWRRPGRDYGHQATTDYGPSPHVMALHSTAPETGLARLHDAGIALTKLRVCAELHYGGDVAALTREVLRAR